MYLHVLEYLTKKVIKKMHKMQENGKKDFVTRSFVLSILAIFGLLLLVLITGICMAAYHFLIIPRISEVSQMTVEEKNWMEDRVAGKFLNETCD